MILSRNKVLFTLREFCLGRDNRKFGVLINMFIMSEEFKKRKKNKK